MGNPLQRRQFSVLAFVFQTIFTVLLGLFGRYDRSILPNSELNAEKSDSVDRDYPLFQDVHVMVVVGFGFLVAFVKRYGFSAISVNLLLSAFVMQYVILLRGFLSREFVTTGFFRISVNELILADLSCVSVLVSMGVLLGKLTPVQFLILAFLESSFAVVMEHILFAFLNVNDAGRSLIVHCFGAYFGLAVAKVCQTKHVMVHEENMQHSELFSMIGTLFLWIFFPSFNAATQMSDDARHRAIINTYLSIASCATTTFLASSLSDHLGRFNILHIQSSTLAGGVAIGSVANIVLFPHHAIIIGTLAALVSVAGHVFISPSILERRLSLYDTTGVHNLHGLPGLLAGVCSVFFVFFYDPVDLGSVIPQSHISLNATALHDPTFESSMSPQTVQALNQLAGIGVTLTFALVGGFISGWIMNSSSLNQMRTQPSYEDTNYYMHAEFSLFGKLHNACNEEEFMGSTKGENGDSPLIQVISVY